MLCGARFDRILGSGSNGDSVRVAFDIDQSVSLQFVGAQGARVQPAEVATVTIKSSVGDRLEFGDVEAPRWLQRSRVVSSALATHASTAQRTDRGRFTMRDRVPFAVSASKSRES